MTKQEAEKATGLIGRETGGLDWLKFQLGKMVQETVMADEDFDVKTKLGTQVCRRKVPLSVDRFLLKGFGRSWQEAAEMIGGAK